MRGLMMLVGCTLLPFAVLADGGSDSATAPAAPAAGQGFGAQTRYWLSTQTSGANAVTESRPMAGEVATMVYQRYLNSFTHPIPERYEADTFSTQGSAGSGTP